MRRLMTQASSAAQHHEQGADRQHRVPERVRGGRARPTPASRPRAPSGVPATGTSVPSHVGAVGAPVRDDFAAATSAAAPRRACPRSVQTSVVRDPRRSALPTPISRPMARPAAGEAARRRKTRKPRPLPRRACRRRLHLGDVLGVEQVAVHAAAAWMPGALRRLERRVRRKGRALGAGRRQRLGEPLPDAFHSSTLMFCGAAGKQRPQLLLAAAARSRDRTATSRCCSAGLAAARLAPPRSAAPCPARGAGSTGARWSADGRARHRAPTAAPGCRTRCRRRRRSRRGTAR